MLEVSHPGFKVQWWNSRRFVWTSTIWWSLQASMTAASFVDPLGAATNWAPLCQQKTLELRWHQVDSIPFHFSVSPTWGVRWATLLFFLSQIWPELPLLAINMLVMHLFSLYFPGNRLNHPSECTFWRQLFYNNCRWPCLQTHIMHITHSVLAQSVLPPRPSFYSWETQPFLCAFFGHINHLA